MLAMGASWPIEKHVKAYCILFLLLETGMLACSCRWISSVLCVLGSHAAADVLFIGVWEDRGANTQPSSSSCIRCS